MKGTLLVVFCILFFVSLANGHSYIECADWRFNNPNQPGWAEDQGTCHGYARKWPKGQYPNLPFGGFDNVWPGYKDQGKVTYGNPTNPDNEPPCHQDFQARTNPITNSYAPANTSCGPMVQTSPGRTLCWTWSGRNHADNGETCVDRTTGVVCPLYINFASTTNNDPTQAQMSSQRVALLTYQNCTRNDPRYNNANRPCGGCFVVPQRAPGIYTVQWRWALNRVASAGYDEIYTTCVDVNVSDATTNTFPTSAQQTSAQQTSAQQTSATQTSNLNTLPNQNGLLYPIADAFVRGGATANTNYGADPTLRVKYSADAGFARESFLRFDFNGVIGPITTCQLELTQTFEGAPQDFAFSFELGVGQGTTWTENAINYNNKPTYTSMRTINKANTQTAITIDVLTYCNQALAGDTLLNFRLFATTETVEQLIFHSKESTTVASRPRLLFTTQGGNGNTDPSRNSSAEEDISSASSIFFAIQRVAFVLVFW